MSSSNIRPLRPPPLQTTSGRPSTAPSHATPTTPTQDTRPAQDTDEKRLLPTKSGHQHFVLTDHVAFRYLEEDPSTSVVEDRAELQGYQCYVVEQWATSRSHPTFAITTYTGDLSHVVVVGVLSVPTDESTWSPRLRVYFRALNQFHARRRMTSLGVLMVTTLIGLPSSLTVIHVPGGDIRKYRAEFFVNENLKRLGCSGRVGLTLAPPAGATIAKFHQLYHTSDKNDIYRSVVELVKLCQTALTIFDKLEVDYADGLLCDVTERAINDWWRDMGSYIYSVEPHDGILGPTTVAGLLGLLMGARNRLHSINAPVAKDAFDTDALKRGIGAFQKQQRVPRSRRLDRRTLERLHRATQKNAEHGGWGVSKAVKSTVAELSGRGGEMVMDAVGRRDRAGIAEIETCDMERFSQLVFGEKPRWLWYGKPLKKPRDSLPNKPSSDDPGNPGKGMSFRENDQGGFAWTGRRSVADGLIAGKAVDQDDLRRPGEGDDAVQNGAGKGQPFVKHSKDGSVSNIDRLKGAVGLKGHPRPRLSDPLPSKERAAPASPQSTKQREWSRESYLALPVLTASPSRASSSASSEPQVAAASVREGTVSRESLSPTKVRGSGEHERQITDIDGLYRRYSEENAAKNVKLASPHYRDINLDEVLPTGPDTEADIGRLLRRTVSVSRFVGMRLERPSDASAPRALSFSLAEESLLTWTPVTDEPRSSLSNPHSSSPAATYAHERFSAEEAQRLRLAINALEATTAPWTDGKLRSLDALLERADDFHAVFADLYQPRAAAVEALQAGLERVLREQKERLYEGRKEIETLVARFDYELDGLRGRVEDVDAGVKDFERGVRRVEERVRELEALEDGGRGWRCEVM